MERNIKLTDKELINELELRFEENKRSDEQQRELMKQLQETNERLRTSENLKTQFLSNIRNEMVNPLTAILGLSSALKVNGDITEEKVREYGELIYNETFTLNFQLRNIIAGAEIEAGLTVPNYVNVNVFNLLNTVIESFQFKLNQKNIEVQFNAHPEYEDVIFQSDTEKLHLIFSNILSNAIEFSTENSKIVVDFMCDEEGIVVAFKDTGIGIEEKNFKAIFNRFNQLDKGVDKNHLGHGLGLSITDSLMELLDGEIHLNSTLGQGSMFSIKLKNVNIDSELEDFSQDGNEFLFNNEEEEIF